MLIRLGRKKPKSMASVLRGAQLYLRLLSAAGVFLSLFSHSAHADLPQPCGGGKCGPKGPANWVSYGKASMSVGANTKGGSTLRVHQAKGADKVILNWETFNIAVNNEVKFEQPSSESVALNRVWDPKGQPSQILGSLTANGRVLVINRNGIVFGAQSQVNMHSLVASTLDVEDRIFQQGPLTANREGKAAYSVSDGAKPGASITVQPGARLVSGAGEFIMLLAPNVENAGRIETPGGQAVLAAGEKVWLAESDNKNLLRGLVVEVDSGEVGGTATNVGEIIAQRGNITLVGFAVNQSGIVRATTSVNLNGSVYLHARDNVGKNISQTIALDRRATRTGRVTFGATSVTEVLPDPDSATTAIDAQAQPQSRIKAAGKTIHLEGGAQVRAAGGTVELSATDPDTTARGKSYGSRVQMDAGSVIDVSGTDDTVFSMRHNEQEVELRGNALRDSPLQRNGVLRGKKVVVDARKGTLLADIAGELAGRKRAVRERLSAGGRVILTSEGDVVVNPGALVDISGGQVRYEGGAIHTTVLRSQGRLYDISAADPDRVYDGVGGSYQRSYRKWGVSETINVAGPGTLARYEPGYVEGKDAGSLTLIAPNPVFNGALQGQATLGRHQRSAPRSVAESWTRPYTETPLRGQFVVGDASQNPPNFKTRAVVFENAASPTSYGLTEALPAGLPLVLTPTLFSDGGVNRVAVHTNGTLDIPADIVWTLAPGGELTLVAGGASQPRGTGESVPPALHVAGAIIAPGGQVTLKTIGVGVTESAQYRAIELASGAVVDTSGDWVNDSTVFNSGTAPAPRFIQGGKVNIESAGDVTLAAGSRISANGGAWLKPSGSVVAGRGGDIRIGSTFKSEADAAPPSIRLDGELQGYGLSQGGTLSVSAPGVRIAESAGAAVAGELWLRPDFFQRGGFNRYTLKSTRTGTTVVAGTELVLRAQNLELAQQARLRPSGTALRELSQVELRPEWQRSAVSLTLESQRTGNDFAPAAAVRVETGASIHTEHAGDISLKSDHSVYIDGTLSAAGGRIDVVLDDKSSDGFLPGKAIWLGTKARLLAPALADVHSNPLGFNVGSMRDAQGVSLTAMHGYIVSEAGSLIDVSGASAQLSVAPGATPDHAALETQSVGAAGSIDLTASHGMLLDGNMRGHAAPLAGAAGGSLALTLTSFGKDYTNTGLNSGYPSPPKGMRSIELRATSETVLPEGLRYGAALLGSDELTQLKPAVPNNVASVAYLSSEQVRSGGFDALELRVDPVESGLVSNTVESSSSARIHFRGDVQLNLRRRIGLSAPVLSGNGGSVQMAAPYIALGWMDPELIFAAAAPSAGAGTFTASADLIDIQGNLSTQGFGSAAAPALRLHSRGDIRLLGNRITGSSAREFSGALRSGGDIELAAAQIYPTTLTHYKIQVEQAPQGRVSILSTGSVAAPLSAAGSLEINAPYITQAGTLRAPLGSIALNAATQLELQAGSTTSVSGAGLSIPFGAIDLGKDWILPFDQQIGVLNAESKPYNVALPEKQVVLHSPDVRFNAGAVVDLSGGGDLYATEFIPGPGGSRDILSAANAGDSFAIVPQLASLYAPRDPLLAQAGLNIGDTIYLKGSDGLPEGEYALLPARYSMLPGAFLVTSLAGSDGFNPRTDYQQPDGTRVIAGKRAVAHTDIEADQWSGFTLQNGQQVRARAQYREAYANDFFTAQAATAALPKDAGVLVIEASQALTTAGRVRNDSAQGRGSRVDIVADRIAVVETRSGQPERVELVATELNGLGASSVLLGGRRRVTQDGMAIDAAATEVAVAQDVTLTAPEILLAASSNATTPGAVTVASGAILQASGAAQAGTDALILSGDSVLLRVSAGPMVDIVRGAVAPSAGARVEIAEGAQLTAQGLGRDGSPLGGSILLDAAGDVVLQGTVSVGSGGGLHLGASRISLGDPDNQFDGQGLVLSNAALEAVNAVNVGELRLFSRNSIDMYGDVALRADNIELRTGAINGRGMAQQSARIEAAQTLRLRGMENAPAASGTGTGQLILSAQRVEIGADDAAQNINIGGFSTVRVAARDDIVALGQGGLNVGGDLALHAARVTAASGADWTLHAAGNHELSKTAFTAALAPLNSLAARLRFEGQRVTHDGNVVLPSGTAIFHANGATAGARDVIFGAGAEVDVGGVAVEFGDRRVLTAGGEVEAISAHGDVRAVSGARIDVSGGAGVAPGGSILVSAVEGTAHLEGEIRANETSAASGAGSFMLDVKTLADVNFTALQTRLNNGGFDALRAMRVREGNLTVNAGTILKAADVTLTADGANGSGGHITVHGTIDASGKRGGSVALNARGDLMLQDGALIDAHATDSTGGSVMLSTAAGSIAFAENATIDVRGTREAASYEQKLDANGAPVQATHAVSGELEFDANGLPVYQTQRVLTTDTGTVGFHAPSVNGDLGVAVTSLKGTIIGAGAVTVEAGLPSQPDADGNLTKAEFTELANDASLFMNAHAAKIAERLGRKNDPRFHVIPVMEIRGEKNLVLNEALDLSQWRFGPRGEPGVLTLRASGDVQLNQDLSDGVNSVLDPEFGIEKLQLRKDNSWTYRIAAGADTASADVLAVKPDTGDVKLGAGVIVRTGTGDIDIVAGRDVLLQDNQSTIYTTGVDGGLGTLDPTIAGYYLNAVYPENGGDLRIAAGRDITAVASEQLINDWLARIGGPAGSLGELPTAWAVNIGKFRQGVAALGGGNASVQAGGSITNLSVSVPTVGKQVGENHFDSGTGIMSVERNAVAITGGDSLRVSAGDDLRGGIYFLGQGDAQLHADRAILQGPHSGGLYPILALGDARFDVSAGTGIGIEAVINPTILPQLRAQGLADLAGDSVFLTYTPDSAMDITALSGDIVLKGGGGGIQFPRPAFNEASGGALGVYPTTLRAFALDGNIKLSGSLELAPSPRSQLELLAAHSIMGSESSTGLMLADIDMSSLPTPTAPRADYTSYQRSTVTPLHAGDPNPLTIIAREGSITDFTLDSAKKAYLEAGADIRNVNITVQHANPDDVTQLIAGRDIAYALTRDDAKGSISSTSVGVTIAGSGRLDLITGRDVDLGTSAGIRSVGNTGNFSVLPDGGADITVMAGAGAGAVDYDAFIQSYLQASTTYEDALRAFVQRYGDSPARSDLDNFKDLPRERQREFLLQVFYSELRAAGRAASGDRAAFARGYAAIETLFPGTNAQAGPVLGNLSMMLSQITTLDDGDINLIVPAGYVNAGVATTTQVPKTPDQLGVVALRQGDVNAFVRGNFEVNQSRVATFDGGDVLIWSSYGDIDAGKGAKTALSAPPPVTTTDQEGNTRVEFSPGVAGSGIRTAVYTAGRAAGNVDLFAPAGVIDAGDAGIDAGGNLTIVAPTVRGQDNIKVGGVAVGVPVVDVGGLGASLSGVSNAASGVGKSAEQALNSTTKSEKRSDTPQADAALSFLQVEVLGYGECAEKAAQDAAQDCTDTEK